MKKILKIISLVLVYAQLNVSLAYAGQLFLESSGNEKAAKVKLGYKFKFGQGQTLTAQEKLAQTTAGADDYFSEQLGTVAVILLLVLWLTVGSKDSKSSAGSSGGGNTEGGEFVDSQLVPTNTEIKDTDQVSEEGIADTNAPSADK